MNNLDSSFILNLLLLSLLFFSFSDRLFVCDSDIYIEQGRLGSCMLHSIVGRFDICHLVGLASGDSRIEYLDLKTWVAFTRPRPNGNPVQ